MSNLPRVAAGLVALVIAGGAVACPGAMKHKSAQGHDTSAQTSSSTAPRS
jgi:hypothetical protein